MKLFALGRFARLLVRVLEISLVIAFAVRWLDIFVSNRYGTEPFRVVGDVAASFSFLALLLLLPLSLSLLVTRQPRGLATVLRTLLYIMVFTLTPFRLGSSARASRKGLTNRWRQPLTGEKIFL